MSQTLECFISEEIIGFLWTNQDKRVLKMASYKCFSCNKKVGDDYVRKRVRCPYCGSKILFKPRNTTTTVEAL